MGSMVWYHFAHAPDEPVTNVTWHDALVWANALSEMESRTPVYYTDEAHTKVYRKAFMMRDIKDISPRSVNSETHRPICVFVAASRTYSFAGTWKAIACPPRRSGSMPWGVGLSSPRPTATAG